MPGRTPEGDALTALVLPVFALNGELLEAAAVITAPHELTPARWQVLGAVLEEPLPVAVGVHTVVFKMGSYELTRQVTVEEGKTYELTMTMDVLLQEIED